MPRYALPLPPTHAHTTYSDTHLHTHTHTHTFLRRSRLSRSSCSFVCETSRWRGSESHSNTQRSQQHPELYCTHDNSIIRCVHRTRHSLLFIKPTFLFLRFLGLISRNFRLPAALSRSSFSRILASRICLRLCGCGVGCGDG